MGQKFQLTTVVSMITITTKGEMIGNVILSTDIQHTSGFWKFLCVE